MTPEERKAQQNIAAKAVIEEVRSALRAGPQLADIAYIEAALRIYDALARDEPGIPPAAALPARAVPAVDEVLRDHPAEWRMSKTPHKEGPTLIRDGKGHTFAFIDGKLAGALVGLANDYARRRPMMLPAEAAEK